MDEIARRLDDFSAAWADLVIRHRWKVILGSLLALIAVGAGMGNLRFKNDYKVWFSPDNPRLVAFEHLQETFTKIDGILFVVAPADGQVFTPDTLAAVRQLTDGSWQIPYAMRVDSVTNFQHTEAVGDELMVADLVADPETLDAGELARRQEIAVTEPNLIHRLINPDASVTAVNVTFQFPLKELTEIPEAVTAARALAAQVEADHPGLKLHLTGTVMMNQSFGEASLADMATLVPIMYLVILAVMWFMTRSLAAVFATTLVIIAAIVSALGAAGWAHLWLTPPTATSPTMIMTLAVADSIHLIVAMFPYMRAGESKEQALRHSLRVNFQPIFLTSVTTAIGFLTLNASDAPPFRDLGNVVAVGVVAAWLFSVTLLPALLSLLPMKAPPDSPLQSLGMPTLGRFVVKNAKALLIASLVVAAGVLSLIPRNELDDQFVEYFDERVPFRTATDFANEHLTGIYQIAFALDSKEDQGVADPAFLAKVDAYAEWLRSQPEVLHVATVTDVFKRLNRNMHGDDPAWYRLPEERDLAAQYLLLYELSLPYGLDLGNQLNVDKSQTMLNVTLITLTSAQTREFADRAEGWLERSYPELATHGVSPTIMFSHVSETNIQSMLSGTLIGLVIISGILMFALRSLRTGLISLVPNLLPAGLAFGLWGLFVGQINMAVSVVSAMTFGIVVDDTVHFLSKYLRARREKGLDREAAVQYAFENVGVALVITTLVLIAGFLVLSMSSFGVNAQTAQLTVMTITLALAVDFLLLPPLLMKFDRAERGPAN